jgi:3-dehydroquinate synthase
MLATFDVRAASGPYRVSIGAGAWKSTLADAKDIVVIADEIFADQARSAGARVVGLPASESEKSLERMPFLIEQLRSYGLSRDANLHAVGGGVVQDIAGFVASVYMRGISWTYFPTTLLAMADSCIGGKSSINVGPYKNIVGTFHPPQAINIDPLFIESQSVEQKVAGLCEAAKICFCSGTDDFDAYCALGPGSSSDTHLLAQVLSLSLSAKARIIQVDEFDRGERLLLNFGHTFAHAIESASRFRVSHGVAVGLGIIAALDLSARLGRPFPADGRSGLLRDHIEVLLRQVDGLAAILGELSVPDLMDAFAADKKHSRQRFVVIVVACDRVERLMLPRTTLTASLIEATFGTILQWFGPPANAQSRNAQSRFASESSVRAGREI